MIQDIRTEDTKLTEQVELSDNENINRQFHPAFCDAMTQIFEHDTVKYEYEREYNLNSMPNRIDFLVIRKQDNGEYKDKSSCEKDDVCDDMNGCVKYCGRKDNTSYEKYVQNIVDKGNTDISSNGISSNGIGKICRKYNIFEYKSPGQQLSVDEYYIAMAYAYLYAGKTKGASMEDITISFVREGKPKKLLSYFADMGYNITEYERGIIHVRKKDHVDMQVIVTRELGDRYIWLKALSDRLTREDATRLAVAAGEETDVEGRKRIRSILDLVSRINIDKDWMKEMKSMGAFRDLFKEEFEEKDRQIQNLSEQLQSKDEQLQSKDEQLQSKDEQLENQSKQLSEKNIEVKSLKEEIEHLKEQLSKNKIAML